MYVGEGGRQGRKGSVTRRMLNISSHLEFPLLPHRMLPAARVSVCTSIGGVWQECNRERERESTRKTCMTDKQRGGGGERGSRGRSGSVGAQQSNIAAKALIMSPDSAVPLPSLPFFPWHVNWILAEEGGRRRREASTASLHAAVGDRASKQATSLPTRWRVY